MLFRSLVRNSVLAYLTEVEVGTYRALVSSTKYGTGSASVTCHVLVLLQAKFLVNYGRTLGSEVFAFHQLLEDMGSVPLQLLLDQFLNRIARWQLAGLTRASFGRIGLDSLIFSLVLFFFLRGWRSIRLEGLNSSCLRLFSSLGSLDISC